MNARTIKSTVAVGFVLIALAICRQICPAVAGQPQTPDKWIMRETDNFRILGTTIEAVDALSQRCEALRQDLAGKWLAKRPYPRWQKRCVVVVYGDATSYAHAIGDMGARTAASTLINMEGTRVVSRRIDFRPADSSALQGTLAHELTHVILAEAFAGGEIPRWLDEGIAILSDSVTVQSELHSEFQSALTDHQEFRVLEMVSRSDYPRGDRLGVFYGQGASVVSFLLCQVSADDDMRPYALMEDSPESLADHEVCRGKLYKSQENGYTRKSFDILSAFLDVLGKPASEVPGNYEQGEMLVDTAMDLETNSTTGLTRENSLIVQDGTVAADSLVKMAQTFRSGTNDIDALDFVDMFLDDERQTSLDELNDFYVLVDFRPVLTKKNWRMDCGVAGYDNTFGLPPFFPTRLRFEDYIYRLWIQQAGIAAAHVDAAQHHTKSNYMRNPPAAEIFNEELANLLKRKIKSSITRLDELSISFDYEGEVTA